MCEFSRLAKLHGFARPATIQNAYSLVNRTFEGDVAEACYREEVALLAYSPLAMGVLSGKYLGGAKPAGARLAKFPDFGERYQREYVASAPKGTCVSRARRGSTPPPWRSRSSAAGRSSPRRSSAPRASRQLEQNIAGASLVLGDDVLRAIDAVHVRYPSPSAGTLRGRMLGETLVLAAGAAGGWFWFDSLRAREHAVALGREACERDRLQFLDETVLCTRTRPARGRRRPR